MFFSRFHYDYGKIHISFDSFTGEILEFYQKNKGDNLIKSAPWGMPSLFAIKTELGVLTVPTVAQVRLFPCLKPEFNISGGRAEVIYSSLCAGDKTVNISVKCVMQAEGDRVNWSAFVTNPDGVYIESFRYPVLGGMWLGETDTDDYLVYPHNAGFKLKSPCEALARVPKKVYWRWQEYRYIYNMDGWCGYKDSEGMYTFGNAFSGPLSMAWCDLYDTDGGIYLGMHGDNGICTLKVSSCGGDKPGLYMYFEKAVEDKGDFCVDSIVTAFHDGDWHDGADIYREYAEKPVTPYPKWWQNSVGLAAHYDFRYQNGGVVHKYADMGEIARQADIIGCDHILCSGWHKGGFDNGFPLYVADDELGGIEGLRKGIADAHKENKKVSFYINSRMGNLFYEDEKEMIKACTVIKADGSPEEEKCGNEELQFVTLCAGSEGWQNRLLQAIKYVADLGADGVYLDQLGMAAPRMCHSKEHGHKEKDEWCKGYRKVIEQAREITTQAGEKLNVIIEGISALYGDIACGGLVSTFVYQHNGACPEIFRYTFPEYCMVDMLYPNKNLAMRPVHVAQQGKEMMERSYLCGMYFWVYDLEQDNTFRRDEQSLEYLNVLAKARKEWLGKHKGYRFVDEKGVCDTENAKAKHFVKGDEGILSYINKGCGKITVDFTAEFDCEYYHDDGKTAVILPENKAGTVYYKKI